MARKPAIAIHGSEGYKRAVARYFEQLGVKPADVTLHEFKKDSERYEAWAVESVLAGLVAFEARDQILAFRCYSQAVEYRARAGGVLPGPILNDAVLALRIGVEDVIRAGGSHE